MRILVSERPVIHPFFLGRETSLTMTSSLTRGDLLSGRHEAYYKAKETFTIHPDSGEPIHFKQGELINMEYSYKVIPQIICGSRPPSCL